jgi:hypothetical protein
VAAPSASEENKPKKDERKKWKNYKETDSRMKKEMEGGCHD